MRYLIYFAYHPDGVIEPHVHHMLGALRPRFDIIHLVHNGPLAPGQTCIADHVQERPNQGFDVGAYRAAMAAIPPAQFTRITELTLANFTFFGPLGDFGALFSWADAHRADFWGISAHAAVTPNPFTGQGTLPYHLNSHWISIRAPMLHEDAFAAWWRALPQIDSYEASVLHHESRFTQHFSGLGYRHAAWLDPAPEGSAYPAFDEAHHHLSAGFPILKRRLFYHQPVTYADVTGANPRAALEAGAFDPALVWPSVTREALPWVLYQNADLLFVVPDASFGCPVEPDLQVVLATQSARALVAARMPDSAHLHLADTWPEPDDHDSPVLYVADRPSHEQAYGLQHLARDAAVRTHAQAKLREPGIGLALPVMRSHGHGAELSRPLEHGEMPGMPADSGVAWIRAGLLHAALKAGAAYADLPAFAAAQGFATICLSNTADLPRVHVKLESRHRAMAGRIGLPGPFEAQAHLEYLLGLASSEGAEKARAELAGQAHDFGFNAGFEQGFDHGFRDGWKKARRPIWRRLA